MKSKRKDIPTFLLNINYVGIGRFILSCKADAGYIEEDTRYFINEFIKKHTEKTNAAFEFNILTLTKEQTRILHSLEYHKIIYDITLTKKDKEKEEKKIWLEEWKKQFENEQKEYKNEYFIQDSKELYNMINIISKNTEENWVYLIGIELYLFKPYYQILEDKKYKVKLNSKYCEDIFAKEQHIISVTEFMNIIKYYIHCYNNILQNKKTKTIVGISATAVATAITGGAGFVFAPQIATLIAGKAVVGLSGAALTSASLAFVGGGSLAVGGLGMAGGTAILTGGGALIGLTGTGVTSFVNVLTKVSDTFILEECAKLITFCKVYLIEKKNDLNTVKNIQRYIDQTINQLVNATINEKDKKSIKQLKINIKYLKKCNKALEDMLN